MLVHDLGKGLVGQQRKVAVHDLVAHARTGAEGGPFRRGDHPPEQFLDGLRARMAHVVVDLGSLRHDVGRPATVGDDVVHAGGARHVLAHQVRHVVHGLDPVQRGSAPMRGRGGMRGDAAEGEPRRFVGIAALGDGDVAIVGMPMQRDVDIVEPSRAGQVDLARTAFLGGGAVDAHRARLAGGCQPVGDGDPGGRRGTAEEVVTAGVAGTVLDHGLATGDGGLGRVRAARRTRRAARSPAGRFRVWRRRMSACPQPRFRRRNRCRRGTWRASRSSAFQVAEFGVVEDVGGDRDGLVSASVDKVADVRRPSGPRDDRDKCRAKEQGRSPRVGLKPDAPRAPARRRHGAGSLRCNIRNVRGQFNERAGPSPPTALRVGGCPPWRRRLDPALSVLTDGARGGSFDGSQMRRLGSPMRRPHPPRGWRCSHRVDRVAWGSCRGRWCSSRPRCRSRGQPSDLSAGAAVAERPGGVAVGEAAHVAPGVTGDHDAEGAVHRHTRQGIAEITGSNPTGHAQRLVLPDAPPSALPPWSRPW